MPPKYGQTGGKQMSVSSEKTGTNEYTLSLSISAEDFEKAVQKAYLQEKNKITVHGFRKGKAPRAMIEKMYGANVFYDTALDIAFPDAYEKAIEEEKLDVVSQPFDFDVKSIGKDGVELTCKVTVKPVIELDGYKGITAPKASAEVTDDEVDAELNKKLEENAREITVEGRAAQNGDIAVIDFEGFVDGVAFDGGKGEDHDLELGSGSFIPGFEDQIIGHNVGDSFDVNVTFPEKYAEDLAGKEAVFKVTLKGLKAKELPALDDEFAKDVSEFDTLDEYKADLKKNLSESKETKAKKDFENEVFKKLAGLVSAEIPECMIDRTCDNMLSEFKYNVESQGIPFDMYLQYLGMTPDSLKASYRERAEEEVRIELALEKIVELENLEVSEEETEKEFADMAERYKIEVDAVKKAVAADTLVRELKMRKASALVTDNAVAEAAEEKTEEKPKKKAPAKKAAKKKTEEETPVEDAPSAE